MRLLPLLTLCMLSAAPAAHATASLHYLTLINRAHARAVQVEAASAGSTALAPLSLARPIDGGGGQATVALRGLGCSVDLRLSFSDGRTVLYSAVNACRGDALVVAPLPAR